MNVMKTACRKAKLYSVRMRQFCMSINNLPQFSIINGVSVRNEKEAAKTGSKMKGTVPCQSKLGSAEMLHL